ncbi:hypothetical protein T484DRAFT_1968373 [Baffinella frigidus]|nr:hypothetical protein T484DRAFT_1968373 [Cryptophyta sp. CCMP2293]
MDDASKRTESATPLLCAPPPDATPAAVITAWNGNATSATAPAALATAVPALCGAAVWSTGLAGAARKGESCRRCAASRATRTPSAEMRAASSPSLVMPFWRTISAAASWVACLLKRGEASMRLSARWSVTTRAHMRFAPATASVESLLDSSAPPLRYHSASENLPLWTLRFLTTCWERRRARASSALAAVMSSCSREISADFFFMSFPNFPRRKGSYCATIPSCLRLSRASRSLSKFSDRCSRASSRTTLRACFSLRTSSSASRCTFDSLGACTTGATGACTV